MSLAMMMDSVRDKQRRQRMILELVRQFAVDSQEAMVSELASRGCTVSQATLSRDLRELRVLRVPTEHGYRYLPAEDSAVGMTTFGLRRPSLATMEVEEVVANEALIVVRTLPARAQAGPAGPAGGYRRRHPEDRSGPGPAPAAAEMLPGAAGRSPVRDGSNSVRGSRRALRARSSP